MAQTEQDRCDHPDMAVVRWDGASNRVYRCPDCGLERVIEQNR